VLPRRFQKSESLTFSMKLPELTNQSLRLLESILDRARERLPANLDFTSCPEFIYLQAENICELGKDVLALEKLNRSRASRILVRPMLESLFALAAAVSNPGFPPRKLNAEWKDENKRIRKWIDEEHRDEFQPVLEEAERKIRDVEQKFSIKEKKEWNAYQTAEEAGQALTWHYRRGYFVFSGNIHSTINALRQHQSRREIILQSVMLIVFETIDHVVSGLKIELSQTQTDQRRKLEKLFKR
jgi:Family of unknown function (DUF5677)